MQEPNHSVFLFQTYLVTEVQIKRDLKSYELKKSIISLEENKFIPNISIMYLGKQLVTR